MAGLRMKAGAMLGVLALAAAPIHALAKDRTPVPVVTSIIVHFYVTGEKKPQDGVTLTVLDGEGTVVARNVIAPSESEDNHWYAAREYQIPVNPIMSVQVWRLGGGKIHIDSGNPAPWAGNISAFATLTDGTTRQIVSETLQPITFNWTGRNGVPFWEGSIINCDRPQ